MIAMIVIYCSNITILIYKGFLTGFWRVCGGFQAGLGGGYWHKDTNFFHPTLQFCENFFCD